MSFKHKYTYEEKERIILEYLTGAHGFRELCRIYGMAQQALKDWIRLYETFGMEELRTGSTTSCYSKEVKAAAVQDYLMHTLPVKDILIKYKIRSTTQLKRRVKKYNGHENLKSSRTRGTIIMAKGKKTSFEERNENKDKHKVYLSAILDLYDRRIVAYVISDRNDNPLVFNTFDKAIAANPGASPLCHSDRGFQYTNRNFHAKLEAAGMTQSMSRVAKCIDNGPMEGFWGILKRERYYGKRYFSKDSLVKMIENYIK